MDLRPLVHVFLAAATAASGSPSIEGRWQTIDDKTGASRSVVHIVLRDGTLSGSIERIVPAPNEDPDPTCTRCRGARKGQKIVGMQILWGHRSDGDRWRDGTILDPENGKEYASTLWLDGDKVLKVRGHWGPFRRTQTWHRMPSGTIP